MLRTKKNTILSGKHQRPILTDIYYKANGQPKQVLIFCHGFKGFKDWGPFNEIATYFAEQDIVYIKFNFSHNGTTNDDPLNFSDLDAFGHNNFSIELDDLGSVIDWVHTCDWLTDEVDLTNINLMGHSRGGGITLLKTAEDNRINKVISWASPANFLKPISTQRLIRWQKTGVAYVYNGRTHQKMPMYYQFYQDCMLHAERLDIISACHKTTIPLLIVHGSDDPTVPIDNAIEIKKASHKAQLHIIDGANHVFGGKHPFIKESFPPHLQQVIKVSVDFLKR